MLSSFIKSEYKYCHTNVLLALFFAIFIYFLSDNILSQVIEIILDRNEYNINSIGYRVSGFVSFCISLATFGFFIGRDINIIGSRTKAILIGIIILCLTILYPLWSLLHGDGLGDIRILYSGAVASFIMLFPIEKNPSKISRIILLLLSVAIAVLPFVFRGVLNAESSFDKSSYLEVAPFINESNPSQEAWVEIELSYKQSTLMKANEQFIMLDSPASLPYYRLSNSGRTLSFVLKRGGLTPLCLLLASKGYGYDRLADNGNKILSCIGRFSKIVFSSQVANEIISMRLDPSLTSQVLQKIRETTPLLLQIKNKRDIDNYLQSTMVRGGVFHHYNSLLHSLNSGAGYAALVKNQYGFGPLLLVSCIKSIFGIPAFDSVVLSVLITNIFLLIFILVNFSGSRDLDTLLIGFFASLAIIYSGSGIMAPMLYPIRYLPTLLLFLLFFKNIRSPRPESIQLYWQVFLGLSIGVWCFEYAIFSLAAIVAGMLVVSARKHLILSASIICGILVVKIPAIMLSSGLGEASYLGYISGSGQGDGVAILSLAYIISMLILVTLAFVVGALEKQQELVVISSLLLFCSFKIIWNGSYNHVGACILMLMSLYLICHEFLLTNMADIVLKREYISFRAWATSDASDMSCSKWTRFGIYLINAVDIVMRTIQSFIFFIIGVIAGRKLKARSALAFIAFFMVAVILSMLNPYLVGRISFEKYTPSNISELYNIPVRLKIKGDSFGSIYQYGDQVISPIDNFISLYVGAELNWPVVDLSTNINNRIELSKVFHKVKDNTHGCFIIDKTLISSDYRPEYIASRLADYNLYVRNNDFLRSFIMLLKHDGFDTTQENSHFTRMCKN